MRLEAFASGRGAGAGSPPLPPGCVLAVLCLWFLLQDAQGFLGISGARGEALWDRYVCVSNPNWI